MKRKVKLVCLGVVSAMILVAFLPSFVAKVSEAGGGDLPEGPIEDYWVYGNITREDGSIPDSVLLAFMNVRTGDVITDFIKTGYYSDNMKTFPIGYLEGDEIQIKARDSSGNGKMSMGGSSTIIGAPGNAVGIDLIVEDYPLLEVPSIDLPPFEPLPDPPPDLDISEGDDGEPLSGSDWEACESGSPEIRENEVIPLEGNLVIHHDCHLIFKNVILRMLTPDPLPAGSYGIYVERYGSQYGQFDVTLGSKIETHTDFPDNTYWFIVNGTLYVSQSEVTTMYGIPEFGGIVFNPGASGTFESDSIVSHGDTHGIYANLANLTITDTTIMENGYGPGGYGGHGVFIDNAYVHIEDSNISDNAANGIYARDMTDQLSSYGQPTYTPGVVVGFFVWWDDTAWHIHASTIDGETHTFNGTVTPPPPAGPIGLLPVEISSGETYWDLSPNYQYLTFDLWMDGARIGTTQITIGLTGWHPSGNPFSLYKYGQALILDNLISSNDYAGIYLNSASPAIIENTISSNVEIGIRADTSTPIIQDNIITVPKSKYGIYLVSAPATIIGNQITAPNPYGFCGIWSMTTSYALIKGNYIASFSYGTHQRYGGNFIENNNITLNVLGISTYYSVARVRYNNITYNKHGIDFRMQGWSIAEYNTITDNWRAGIAIHSRYHNTTTNVPIIQHNVIMNNVEVDTCTSPPCGVGIFIYRSLSDLPVSCPFQDRIVGTRPIITENEIKNNDYGIYSSWSAPNVTFNQIESNNIAGVYVLRWYHDVCNNHYANATIYNNSITSNINYGIYVNHASPLIYGDAANPQNISDQPIGIYLNDSSPLILGNNISFNTNSGIEMYNYSEPLIEGNVVQNNEYNGIAIYEFSIPIINDNEIIFTKDQPLSVGIHVNDFTDAIITNNIIYDSASETSGGYAGINIRYAGPTIEHNEISSGRYGVINFYSSPIINENNITNNTVNGIYSLFSSYPYISKNNILDNGWGFGYSCPPPDDLVITKEPSAGIAEEYSNSTITDNTIMRSGQTNISTGSTWPGYFVLPPSSPGIEVYGFSNTMIYGANTIMQNGIGIVVRDSIAVPYIWGNEIILNNGDGIYTEWAAPTIGGYGPYQNIINGNLGWGIHLRYNIPTNAITLQYDNDFTGGNNLGWILQEWKLDVWVYDSVTLDPIEDAHVWAINLKLETELDDYTNSDGYVMGTLGDYRVENSGIKVGLTPHMVCAEKIGDYGKKEQNPTMHDNQELIFYLDPL